MKWSAEVQNRKYTIDQEEWKDGDTGEVVYQYTLGVWQDKKCIDHQHQDTLEITIDSALEDYGVPKDAWRQVEN